MTLIDARALLQRPSAPVSRCPICDSTARPVTGEWTDYACGARVISSPHGSWSLSVPCPVNETA